MRKYYWAIITMTADWLLFDKDWLHRMFRVWFKKKTTSWISYDEWYEYLENVLDFIAEIRGRRYDSDWYNYENISYYDLEYAKIDDYFRG